MSMFTDRPNPDARGDATEALLAEARDWVLRVSEAPELSAECAQWRQRDPAHEAAYRRVDGVWSMATGLDSFVGQDWRAEAAALGHSPAARVRHWALRGPGRAILPLAMAASLAAIVVMPKLVADNGTHIETGIAQTRQIALADGSRVTIGAKSGVAVRYTGDSRQVVLDSGQAFFEVAHDPARPFTVIAGDAEIRVTGTRFDVRRVNGEIEVSVLEGRVELRKRALLPILRSQDPDRVLGAGLRAQLDPGKTFSPAARSPVTPGEWRAGRLFYSEAPLGQIVADVQRYSPIPIRITDDVGALRLTTTVRPGDIDQFFRNIEAVLPVEARKSADGAMTIAHR